MNDPLGKRSCGTQCLTHGVGIGGGGLFHGKVLEEVADFPVAPRNHTHLGQRRNCNLPPAAGAAGNMIEVRVAAEDGLLVLAGNRGNPEVIHWNGRAGGLQFKPDVGIMAGGCNVAAENLATTSLAVFRRRVEFL